MVVVKKNNDQLEMHTHVFVGVRTHVAGICFEIVQKKKGGGVKDETNLAKC